MNTGAAASGEFLQLSTNSPRTLHSLEKRFGVEILCIISKKVHASHKYKLPLCVFVAFVFDSDGSIRQDLWRDSGELVESYANSPLSEIRMNTEVPERKVESGELLR